MCHHCIVRKVSDLLGGWCFPIKDEKREKFCVGITACCREALVVVEAETIAEPEDAHLQDHQKFFKSFFTLDVNKSKVFFLWIVISCDQLSIDEKLNYMK